jgi:F-type H+-transporting ATPase subunit c
MKLRNVLVLIAMILIAVPAFAQTPAAGTSTPVIPVAFAMAIASGLCGLAQGKAIAAACEGIARNPGAAGAIRVLMLLGLAFVESLALFTLVTVLG